MLQRLKTSFFQSSHTPEAGEGFENDKPKSGLIATMSIALIIILITMWFAFEGLMWYATNAMEADEHAKNDAVLLQQRIDANTSMNSYDIADEEKGFYRIPIEQAIDKLVKQSSVEIK